MAKRKRLTVKQKRSRAAKRGWATRRKKQREKIERWEDSGAPIVPFEGPHKRPGLSKDFDDLTDFERLAIAAKEEFGEVDRYSFAFRLRFIPDVNEPEEFSERWVSLSFDRRLGRQTQNARDYLDMILSRRDYGLVVPIESAIMVQQ